MKWLEGLSKKQRTNLQRIIAAALLLLIIAWLPLTGLPRFLAYAIPYLLVGYDVLCKAWKGIVNRQPLDENLLMAIATLGAMALAIDNFKISAELEPVPTAKHYIYVIDETGYPTLGLYAYADGQPDVFGAWPGERSVDEKVIGDDTYKVFLLDAESGDYKLIFNNWNNDLQLPDYAITANRDYYFRVTSTTVTEVTPTAIHSITQQDEVSSPFVYDLQGRKVGTTNTSLPKGIYIKNGKKYLVR
jgi:hypothetical protein